MADENLQTYRELIDQADRSIVKAIEQRLDAVAKIGAYKKANGLAVYDPKREAVVLEHVSALCTNPSYAPYIRYIYQKIMDVAKQMEE